MLRLIRLPRQSEGEIFHPFHPLYKNQPGSNIWRWVGEKCFKLPRPPVLSANPCSGEISGEVKGRFAGVWGICPFCTVLTKAGIIYEESRSYTVSLFDSPQDISGVLSAEGHPACQRASPSLCAPGFHPTSPGRSSKLSREEQRAVLAGGRHLPPFPGDKLAAGTRFPGCEAASPPIPAASRLGTAATGGQPLRAPPVPAATGDGSAGTRRDRRALGHPVPLSSLAPAPG